MDFNLFFLYPSVLAYIFCKQKRAKTEIWLKLRKNISVEMTVIEK
jgi:hypothetical protein